MWFTVITECDFHKSQKDEGGEKDTWNTSLHTPSPPASSELLVSCVFLACCPPPKTRVWHEVVCRGTWGNRWRPEANLSQRAGQLGTSRPSNHPAARLNLQSCSAVRLKEAARRAHLSAVWSDLIFLGWRWEGIGGVEGLIGLPRCSLEWRTTEADGSETRVW